MPPTPSLRPRAPLDATSRLSNAVETGRGAMVHGFIDECRFFQTLRKLGIFAVRAAEQAPDDGAFVDPTTFDPAMRTQLQQLSYAACLQWTLDHPEATFITFNVKHIGIYPRKGVRGSDIRFSQGSSHFRDRGAVAILTFTNVSDYVAIVPGDVYRVSSGALQGQLPLLTRIPPWVYPFMVHLPDLPQAVVNLLRASRDQSSYTNPTTGTTLCGWYPAPSIASHLLPDSTTPMHSSVTAILQFWRSINAPSIDPWGRGATAEMNWVAPLLGDFVLRWRDSPGPILVEHKSVVAYQPKHSGALTFRPRESGPSGGRDALGCLFHPTRQWHICLLELKQEDDDDSGPVYACIGRHEVQPRWHEIGLADIPSDMIFRGPRALAQVLDKIKGCAHLAVAAARRAAPRTEPSEYLKALCSSNAISFWEQDNGAAAGDGSTDPSDSRTSKQQKYLPWLCDKINQLCARNRSLVCLPLDPGHPIANHVLVEHTWTEGDLQQYEGNGGILPVTIYDKRMQNKNCVPVRIQNMGPQSSARENYTGDPQLWMYQGFWAKPATLRPFLIVGSLLDESFLANAPASCPYLVMPVHLTRHLEEGHLRHEMGFRDHGRRYFRLTLQEDELIPEPQANTHHTRSKKFKLNQQEILQAGVNPLRYLVHLDELHRLASNMLRGGPVEVGTRQTSVRETFDAAPYIITVADMNQSQWDFGLTRIADGPDDVKESRGKVQVCRRGGNCHLSATCSESLVETRPPAKSTGELQ